MPVNECGKRIRGNCIDCGVGITGHKTHRCRPCNTKHKKKHKDRGKYVQDWHRNKKYGLEFGEFDVLWIVFKGKCGICGCDMKLPLQQRGQPLDVVSIDHDHTTGKFRGLLCNSCNKGLGLFKDNLSLLEAAVRYLKLSQKE